MIPIKTTITVSSEGCVAKTLKGRNYCFQGVRL